jgi:hypothetical protein
MKHQSGAAQKDSEITVLSLHQIERHRPNDQRSRQFRRGRPFSRFDMNPLIPDPERAKRGRFLGISSSPSLAGCVDISIVRHQTLLLLSIHNKLTTILPSVLLDIHSSVELRHIPSGDL